ncbi:MAG TPA: FmdB family zinc ribbon protein [Bryobacteraceae bacterium]|nr:FmdB family zinc ribbon protein [Bryobacteraceae bacterium]
MPLYEYKCKQCGKQIEVMQRFSDEPLKVHEDCGGEMERLLSAPALQFKGSGWYITDYARSGNGGAGNKKSETKSDNSGSSSSTTPSTPSSSSSGGGDKGGDKS